jgi:HD-like signal output (HDOD) protein
MTLRSTNCRAAITRNDIRPRLQLWLDRLPPFPMVLHRLLATLAMDPDDISLLYLADLVETDTLIAGKVVGIANSSFYSRGQTVCSVRQAVIRLGVDRLRNVLLSLSINSVWGGLVIPNGFSILRFNQHALATAILCDLLTQRLHVKGAEVGFITGLFHDIGELVLVGLFPDQYISLRQQLLDGEVLEWQERQLLGFSHAEMSAEATAHWNLPEKVQTAVRLHERPVSEERTLGHEEFTVRDILHAADRCATGFGMCVFDSPSKDDAVEEALSPLGIKESEIADEFLQQLAAFDDCDRQSYGIDPATRLAG